jgi:hypothetical protein
MASLLLVGAYLRLWVFFHALLRVSFPFPVSLLIFMTPAPLVDLGGFLGLQD